MTDLFTEPCPELDESNVPEISESDANLNFTTVTKYTNMGLGAMDEPEPYTSYECTFPEWSGIVQKWTDRTPTGDVQKSFPLTITTRTIHHTAASLINEWLKSPENAKSEAGKWIFEHAAELNKARRYWDVKRMKATIEKKRRNVEESLAEIRRMEISFAVNVAEVNRGVAFTTEERKLKLREFGAENE